LGFSLGLSLSLGFCHLLSRNLGVSSFSWWSLSGWGFSSSWCFGSSWCLGSWSFFYWCFNYNFFFDCKFLFWSFFNCEFLLFLWWRWWSFLFGSGSFCCRSLSSWRLSGWCLGSWSFFSSWLFISRFVSIRNNGLLSLS